MSALLLPCFKELYTFDKNYCYWYLEESKNLDKNNFSVRSGAIRQRLGTLRF
jgi:hypothetical protein